MSPTSWIPSPDRPVPPSRWILLSLLFLLPVVGGLYLVSSRGHRTLTLVQNVLRSDAEWNRFHQQAVLHLQAYALSGDEGEWEAYQDAMAYPRAVRPAFRAAVEHAGDGTRMREALESSPLVADRAEFWSDFAADVGDAPEVVEVSRIRLRKADLLHGVDTLAAHLRTAVREEGVSSPPVGTLAAEIRTRSGRIDRITEPLWNGLTEWASEQQRSMQRQLAITSVLLLLGGVLVVGFAGWQARGAEKKMLESEERFLEVTRNIEEVFWLRDAGGGEILYVSPAYEQIWGRPVERLYDDPGSWLDTIHPEDRERIRERLGREPQPDRYREYRIVRPDGEVRWIRDRIFPILDDEGEMARLAGIAEDHTRQREMEREILRSQELKSVGRLAGGIGHAFNNLLTVIKGHLDLLAAESRDERGPGAELEEAQRAVEKAAQLTRRLLSFAGRQMLDTRTVDLSSFVRESTDMVRRLLQGRIELELSLDDDVRVRADPSHLRDILLTLAGYCADRMGDEGGALTVRTDVTVAPEPFAVEGGRLGPGGWGTLIVESAGEPIRSDARRQLFEPFGAPDRGEIQLAMAAVFGVVEQGGGGIRVVSGEGAGNRFVVYLPWSDGEEAAAGAPTDGYDGPAAGEDPRASAAAAEGVTGETGPAR